MTNPQLRTLAYTKSPKTSKRTTFQDELQAAISARVNKTKADQYSYSDDFDEDGDDIFNKLLKTRKKRSDAFKAGKSKAKINSFELSDDEDKQSRTKKVSFLKTQRIRSPLNDTQSNENEPPDSSFGDYTNNGSFSTNVSEGDAQFKNSGVESTDPQIPAENSSISLSYQTSDDTLLDMSLPLPSDSSVVDTPGPQEKSYIVDEEGSQTSQLSMSGLNHAVSAGSVIEREPPRPKPRQRTVGLSSHTREKPAEEAESQSLSRPQTSSASIPLSSDASSNIAVRSCSPQESLGDHSDQLSHVHDKSFDSRTSSSHLKTPQRPQSVCSRKVESKYLGTLKLLDRKVSLQESQPQATDSLRAAIYQEWLKKKKVKSRENLQQKKKEEALKEKKKEEQEAKKDDAVASYEAWKEKKAESLKAKAKEKQDMIKKGQKATEEKEEKRHSAQQVFEKWKGEHDHLLKEKYRKEKEAENRLKLKKQEKDEDRKTDSKSAFCNWCEKKKDVLHEKHRTESKEIQNKAEEEQYMKEERDKMALDMYENWLARKDLEQKRHREERRIQAILRDSPPPPWSPPNKTIPFRK
ncbi:microtubule-associated protein 9 isoform X2 [Brachyistius frenatus]|uniref:microtubule-associated protein 9 isoform X2 n=1 Tax=Brachyistius frenatus TaxID=100188 RepID=UPI0037E82BC7